MKELTIDATVENIGKVTAFVDEQLEALGCPMKAQMQIDIAIDELFGNIAHYAYNPEVGPATVRVDVLQKPLSVVVTFIDNGIAYDPLAREDPDVALTAEEREIGGLGIYMVKKSMDESSIPVTIEKLSELKNIPIMELQREELSNAAEVAIDPSKTRNQRVQSFLEQMKNPFAQNVGEYILQIGYLEGTKETLDDRMVLLARKQAMIL